MKTKTIGALMTAITGFVYGLPAIVFFILGSLFLAGKGTYRLELFGGVGRQMIDPAWGYILLVAGIMLIAVPMASGILTLRTRS